LTSSAWFMAPGTKGRYSANVHCQSPTWRRSGPKCTRTGTADIGQKIPALNKFYKHRFESIDIWISAHRTEIL
jgi:hypothetical protein